MTSFPLVGPDGKSYSVEADTLENAQKALAWEHTQRNQLADPNTGQPIDRLPGGTMTPTTDFMYGLREPADNASVLLARGLAAAVPSGFTERNLASARENAETNRKAYEEAHAGGPPDDSTPRTAGQQVLPGVASIYMPGSTAARAIPRVLSNTVGGGLTSVLSGDPNAPPDELAGRAVAGGALGAGSAMATGAGARIADPVMARPGSDVRNLMDLGVRPTPGQMMGGAFNRIEQGVANVTPLTGDMIKASRRRGVLSLNEAMVNDVLAPIGVRLPQDTEIGRPALNFMADQARDAYQAAVPAAGAFLDPTAERNLQQLHANTRFLSRDQREQFDNIMQAHLHDKISQTRHLSGESFKEAESALGQEANNFLYNRNSNPNELKLGNALREAQAILRENLERSDPATAAAIRAANQTFARMQTVSRAVAQPSMDPGVFSPAGLQRAAYDETLSRNARMRGTGPYMAEGDMARRVLGPTIPDSGTPYGQMMRVLGGIGGLTGGGAAGVDPHTLALALGVAGGVGSIYNPVMQPLMAHLMATRHPAIAAMAQPIRAATPLVTTGAVHGLLGPDEDQR